MILQSLMLAILGLGFAADDNAEKIVGVWTIIVTDGDKDASETVEFTKDGKVKHSFVNGMDLVRTEERTYKIEKDKVSMTSKTPEGKESTRIGTIKVLTKDTLVLIYLAKEGTIARGKEPVFKNVEKVITMKRK